MSLKGDVYKKRNISSCRYLLTLIFCPDDRLTSAIFIVNIGQLMCVISQEVTVAPVTSDDVIASSGSHTSGC